MLLDLSQIALLFIAGVFGGVLNSVAGGGSFITFPTLLFVGIPPLSLTRLTRSPRVRVI
ncbi:predicted permease [Vibrio maritimus]|uniref:Predicted permease n=1 Tax=Vibrio maritimus TaxID=990268 RepID=A0A090TDF2_9VIBR|nr:predicted permease [Vibrio maritimus]